MDWHASKWVQSANLERVDRQNRIRQRKQRTPTDGSSTLSEPGARHQADSQQSAKPEHVGKADPPRPWPRLHLLAPAQTRSCLHSPASQIWRRTRGTARSLISLKFVSRSFLSVARNASAPGSALLGGFPFGAGNYRWLHKHVTVDIAPSLCDCASCHSFVSGNTPDIWRAVEAAWVAFANQSVSAS
jgi:hypothetical protein